MNNVVAFPAPLQKPAAPAKASKSMTLFLHVKCATLIMHVAGAPVAASQTGQAAKS
jgi:hypothetical protein